MRNKTNRTPWLIGAIVLFVGAAYLLAGLLDRKNKETPIVASTLPELEDSYASGQSLYQSNCSACHGKALGGQKGIGPPLIHDYYKPGHHSDIAFYRAIEQGVAAHHWEFGNMPPVSSVSKSDASEIIRFIRAVQRANGIK